MNYDSWVESLGGQFSSAINLFCDQNPKIEIAVIACDCHPWDGIISLCALTSEERSHDSEIDAPSEMAAWSNFHFPDQEPTWQTDSLCETMRYCYENSGAKVEEADIFLSKCASALTLPSVARAIERIQKSADFRLSVPHPDDDREFVKS